MKRIFITGASGCIGHYIVESLIKHTEHQLYLLVRNPDKLQFDWQDSPRIHLLKGDLRDIADHSDLLLKEINIAILAATSWGGAIEAYDINVVKTLALLKMLNPSICEQVLYFSTASVLDRHNQLLPEANQFGTDYIRTKYQCLSGLSKLEIADRITVLFPTLVFGGDNNKPYSHLTSGLPEVIKWIDLIRCFKVDGSFHFVHGQDIAQIVTYLIQNPQALVTEENTQSLTYLVLGNKMITANDAIAQICQYFNKKLYVRIPLYIWLINIFVKIFRIQMDSWSYFSLNYRHFTHKKTITPASFGLTTYCSTINDVMKLSGL
ncbi:NAD dependent epimerase/dehydratase family protein [Xenococcus sp. PCC 7305]|uniref:NAD-dependent epimerase/dehydratase family protein n=1 Tax=Xenococcus sp. PCC 7305 TaxID=102125 RepID=UPI0002ABCB26|nr:NAD(P)-dependent oxidoreductase [Xenococcus sp. PCC 7305]ELS04709.1 NAD dependent epimerase/dehydratase family protein [Xenococcus sp. PCC 7305]